MHASVNLRAAALEALKRTKSRPRALAAFVSKLQGNKVMLAALAEPYLNSVAESLVPVEAHVRTAPASESANRSAPQGLTRIASDSTSPDQLVPASEEAISRASGLNPSRRGFGIIDAVNRIVKRSIFDTYTLPDGRTLRQVRWRELPGLVERFGNSARVLTIIMNHTTLPVDTGQYVSDVVGENVVTSAIEEVNNAVAA